MKKKSIEKPYEQDEYFKKWLVGLSPRTKENYSDDFYDWWQFIKMSPTEQIEKRLKDTRSDSLEDRMFYRLYHSLYVICLVDN
jgi:hypothetical protein